MNLVTAADKIAFFREQGFSFFALRDNSKKPSGGWEHFKDRQPVDRETANWAFRNVQNFATVTGSISGNIVGLDYDPAKMESPVSEYLERWLTGYMVSTPTGGYHAVYRLPARYQARSSSSKIAPGVDTRGEGGYLVGPGSTVAYYGDDAKKKGVVSGHIGSYDLIGDGQIAEAPADLIAFLLDCGAAVDLEAPQPQREQSRRERSSGDVPETHLADILSYIPTDGSYEDWLTVIMAVHSELPDQRGINLLNKWWAEDQPGLYAEKFKSLKKGYDGKPITIGTLIALAKQHGYKPKAQHWQRYETPAPLADVTGCAPYMSDLPIPEGDVLLIGDMGTGKTTWAAKQRVRTAPTHRVALSKALAAALSQPGHVMENYQGLTGPQLNQVPNLTICLNSISKAPERLPGTLFVDEIRQVLAHQGGDTFSGPEAESAYNIHKSWLQRGSRVIAADAHADELTVRWLKHLRPNLKVVVNTYARERGPLTMWERKSGLLARVWQLADQDTGPVVIVTGSKNYVRDLERAAGERYGEQAVMAVYQDVTSEPDRKEFLEYVNQHISNYRVVIFSPTVGSGIDIQTRVRAVCGFFFSEPLTAPDCHQMLNRCRHTEETHVFVQRTEGQRQTDPMVIYQEALANARQTGHVAHFDENGLLAYTDGQRELHWLLAQLEAADNASKNRLYDHFMTLAQGYSEVIYSDLADHQQDELTAAQREIIRELDRSRTLTAPVVTYQQYRALLESGNLTQEQRDGYNRWQIEQCAGRDIDSVSYDLLHSSQGRAALYFLADHRHGDLSILADLDRGEHSTLPGKRRHYTRRKILADDLIQRVFGSGGLCMDARLTAGHIQEAVSGFINVAGDEMRRLFKRRADLSQQPVPFLRWFLGLLGLRLVSKSVRDGDGWTREYSLEKITSLILLDLAESCHMARERRRLERLEKEDMLQNTDSDYLEIREMQHEQQAAPAAALQKSHLWKDRPGFWELIKPSNLVPERMNRV